MDLKVNTAMAIEGEVDDAWSIWDMSVKDKRNEIKPSSSSRKKQGTFAPHGFQEQGRGYQGQGQGQSSRDGRHFRGTSHPMKRTCFHISLDT